MAETSVLDLPKKQFLGKVELVRKYGGATTDAVLDPACQTFAIPGVEGFIGYRIELDCAIVFGDPICSKQNMPILAKAFEKHCKERNYQVIYVVTSKSFSDWALQEISKISIEFGQQILLDPQHDPRDNTGVHGSLVRRKSKHALKEGVHVEEYFGGDLRKEKEIEAVGHSWLQGRQGPQIHISHVHLFENRFGKRWFYAECQGKVVGALVLNHLDAKDGWLLNHHMITKDAPHGTPELLIVSALEVLKKEGCSYVTIGAVPSPKLTQIVGLSSFSQMMVRFIYLFALKYFNLQGRMKFWEKYEPQTEPSFLIFSQKITLKTIGGLMKALNAIS